MANPASPPSAMSLAANPMPSHWKATILFFAVAAVGFIGLGALTCEGIRSPSGLFGDLGREMGEWGAAVSFAGAFFSMLISVCIYRTLSRERESALKTQKTLKVLDDLKKSNPAACDSCQIVWYNENEKEGTSFILKLDKEAGFEELCYRQLLKHTGGPNYKISLHDANGQMVAFQRSRATFD